MAELSTSHPSPARNPVDAALKAVADELGAMTPLLARHTGDAEEQIKHPQTQTSISTHST